MHAPEDHEYPLSEVPAHARKGLGSLTVLLFGFTFFTATMFAGGSLSTALDLRSLLWATLIGNLLLGAYAATLGWIAARSGLTSVLMGRFCFGERGSKLCDGVLGLTQIGWYAWGVATIAIVLSRLLGLSDAWQLPLMVLFGFGFCVTALIGYRGLDWLSRVSVPAMLALLLWSMGLATRDSDGMTALLAIRPEEPMPMATAVSLVFATFVSGGTQATNWTRFARSGRIAVIASMAGFFLGNGLMLLVGAYTAIVYAQPDIVEVLVLQGLSVAALTMLFLNMWTTQDNTIYNFAAAGCNLLRTDRRRTVIVGGAAIGTALAIGGMADLLVPYLLLLGAIIPPIGGVIIADYVYGHRGRWPAIRDTALPAFNWVGLGAYGAGCASAFASPWLAPLVGIVVAVLAYGLLFELRRAMATRRAAAT